MCIIRTKTLTFEVRCCIVKEKGVIAMAKVATNISLDKDDKAEAQAILGELGLDLSTLFGICLKKVIAVGGIPFDVRLERPNAETMEAIAEVKAMKARKIEADSYNTAEEMMEDLLG